MKDLQNIKDDVSKEWGHTDWNDFGESFKHRLGSAHAERDEVVTEIAIRYAQEQNRELVEMLEECVSVLTWTLENARPDSDWTTFTNSITNAIVESDKLITKHKQS